MYTSYSVDSFFHNCTKTSRNLKTLNNPGIGNKSTVQIGKSVQETHTLDNYNERWKSHLDLEYLFVEKSEFRTLKSIINTRCPF